MLAFLNGLDHRHFDFSTLIANRCCTLCIIFVRFSLVTPEVDATDAVVLCYVANQPFTYLLTPAKYNIVIIFSHAVVRYTRS